MQQQKKKKEEEKRKAFKEYLKEKLPMEQLKESEEDRNREMKTKGEFFLLLGDEHTTMTFFTHNSSVSLFSNQFLNT